MTFEVRTTDGTLVNDNFQKGFSIREAAEADAADRNKRAEELGIKTRYEVKPR